MTQQIAPQEERHRAHHAAGRRMFALACSVLLHGVAFSLLAQGFEGELPTRQMAIQVELVTAQSHPVAVAETKAAPPRSPPPPSPKPQTVTRPKKQAPVAVPQPTPALPAAGSERPEIPEENTMQAALAPATSGDGGASSGEKTMTGSHVGHPSSPATSSTGSFSPAIFAADYLSNPSPAYPPLARRRGEEGQVLLRVLVSTAGRAAQLELQQSSGSPLLDEAAQTAVRQWKFIPAQRGGVAVESRVLVPIVFRLE